MAIKIVTDSTADLPSELAQELGITVVPIYVRFGEEVYRDRVNISEDEFSKDWNIPRFTLAPFSRDHKIFLRSTGSCQQRLMALLPSISRVN